MTRTRLTHAPELLDEHSHDDAVLRHSLGHVAQVNRFLGGYAAVLSALRPLLVRGAHVHILDVGTATADIPRAIAAAARDAGASVLITATDLHPQMRTLAAELSTAWPEISIEEADALNLRYADHSFDAVTLCMTLHHFEDEAPVTALREAGRVGRLVVVSDLERSWINYMGARLLGVTWWRRNPLTRHDGPLSVLRAFTAAELRDIAARAGLTNIVVRRRWFCRLLLTASAS